jgi:hypothetical protein
MNRVENDFGFATTSLKLEWNEQLMLVKLCRCITWGVSLYHLMLETVYFKNYFKKETILNVTPIHRKSKLQNFIQPKNGKRPQNS